MDRNLSAASLQANREILEVRTKTACEDRLNRCIAHIEQMSAAFPTQEYTIFTVPQHLDGDPPFLPRERMLTHVIDGVRKRGFFIRRCKDGTLFISWDPQHTPPQEATEDKVNRPRKKRRLNRPLGSEEEDDDDDDVITYRPNSKFGDLFLRTQLMARNPKYSKYTR